MFPVDKVFPCILRFEALRRWVCAARSPTRRVGAGLTLANGEDFCEAFLRRSVWVGPANIYLASDGDGLRGGRLVSVERVRERQRETRQTWIEYVPPGETGAGSEPSASLFGPIVKPEASSEVQRRFRVVARGLEIQRTLCCAGDCLSRAGPIRSWQLIARYIVPRPTPPRGTKRTLALIYISKFEEWLPTLNVLLWLLQRTEPVIYNTSIFGQETANRLTGKSYHQIAQEVKTSEQRIIDSQFGTLATSNRVAYRSMIQSAPVPLFQPKLNSGPSPWLWESRTRYMRPQHSRDRHLASNHD